MNTKNFVVYARNQDAGRLFLRNYRAFVCSLLILISLGSVHLFLIDRAFAESDTISEDQPIFKKLYWFIPDGMRAEPYVFNIYEWAKEGKLPNVKRMMDNGSYGFCKPVFPGHTPVNFATLFTGAYPEVHGVADGPMHIEGRPLTKPSIGGFSSTAKMVEPIWVTLERENRVVGLLSIPGSTPPELEFGYTINGRWGGWGTGFYAVNFEEFGDGSIQYNQGRQSRLFFFGPRLAVFKKAVPSREWRNVPKSYSPAKEVTLEAWGAKVFAYIYDNADDQKANYSNIIFSADKQDFLTDLKEGEWSRWLPITLGWKGMDIETQFKIKVIKLDEDGYYRIRFFYNNINETLTKPSFLAKELIERVGPMVDFVDNFPPQLIFYDEDKKTFIEEANMSFAWHRDAASYFLKKYDPDVFIHDIYTPNQMLTSRWWLGYIDPNSKRYNEKMQQEREQLWTEVHDMYSQLDKILGEYLDHADENTIVALSSDHGAAPLDKWVHLNNLFSQKGWLKFKIDSVTGDPIIDWEGSQVVYLKFNNIYINPKGLHNKDGKWYRASGKEYDLLREDVIKLLIHLDDEDGVNPVVKIAKWEDSENTFRLPGQRV
ncbi:alkaline phosphatase family protein, partial [Candidatus Pacearchaeota archaeon]|nr:alkaline phosphatase family protein [Candidatus Pacearchaeota archaeon]